MPERTAFLLKSLLLTPVEAAPCRIGGAAPTSAGTALSGCTLCQMSSEISTLLPIRNATWSDDVEESQAAYCNSNPLAGP